MKSNLNYVVKKIRQAKLKNDPFPNLLIENFLPKKILNNFIPSLPSFNQLHGNNIFIQSKSNTKRSIFYNSSYFKKIMNKNSSFKEVILIFSKIESFINKKFEKEIEKYIKKEFIFKKTTFSCSISSSIKGYLKSAHIDRREHKFHILYYPEIQKNSGGDLKLWKSKNQNIYDVFPNPKKISFTKKIKASGNTCLISLNTPFAYHSVTKYNCNKERKYLYVVFDFPTSKKNYKIKQRKIGNNQNIFWKTPVKVFSKRRKLNFINE